MDMEYDSDTTMKIIIDGPKVFPRVPRGWAGIAVNPRARLSE